MSPRSPRCHSGSSEHPRARQCPGRRSSPRGFRLGYLWHPLELPLPFCATSGRSLSTLLPPRAQLSSKLRMPFRLGRATRHRSGRSGELQPPTTPSRSAHQPKEQKPPLNLRNPLPRSRAHAFFLGSGRIRLHRRRVSSSGTQLDSFR